jgi:hypothetical protein
MKVYVVQYLIVEFFSSKCHENLFQLPLSYLHKQTHGQKH